MLRFRRVFAATAACVLLITFRPRVLIREVDDPRKQCQCLRMLARPLFATPHTLHPRAPIALGAQPEDTMSAARHVVHCLFGCALSRSLTSAMIARMYLAMAGLSSLEKVEGVPLPISFSNSSPT